MAERTGRIAAGFTAKFNLLIDLALVAVALVLSSDFSAQASLFSAPLTAALAVAAFVTWVVTASALRHYDPSASDREALDDAALVAILVMAVTTLLAVGEVLLQTPGLPRLPQFLLVVLPALLTFRLLVVRPLQKSEAPLDEVLMVGTGPMARSAAIDIRRKARRHVLGFVQLPNENDSKTPAGPALGGIEELDAILRSAPVAEVYLAFSSQKHGELMQKAIGVCERYGIPFALPAYGFRLERAHPVARRAISDGFLHFVSQDARPYERALKRLVDIAVSAVAIWMLVPLLTVVALAIKLTSRGPVFFKQMRVGLYGKPFHLLKFRSMVTNAEALKATLTAQNEQSGPVFKMKHDPRVTRIGRFIRKFSIDELPQLINILRGDMSIVGPRPPVPAEVALYEPWQRRRLSVPPGLTCIWQVSGRNQISFEQWMYMDMQYIDHWSLGQDLSLMLKTVPVVLTGKGAS